MKDQYTEFSWGLICGEAAVRSGEKNQASGYQIYIKASCTCNIGYSFISEFQQFSTSCLRDPGQNLVLAEPGKLFRMHRSSQGSTSLRPDNGSLNGFTSLQSLLHQQSYSVDANYCLFILAIKVGSFQISIHLMSAGHLPWTV